MTTDVRTGRRIAQRVGSSSSVELEYYCRGCKGHYSTTVPVVSLWQAACRCGSRDLLVYSVAGEFAAPLRSS